jgi:hypothetical protein
LEEEEEEEEEEESNVNKKARSTDNLNKKSEDTSYRTDAKGNKYYMPSKEEQLKTTCSNRSFIIDVRLD